MLRLSDNRPVHKKRVAIALIFGTITILSTLLAASCTQGTYGIFASLESEKKITDRGLDNGLTATQMTTAGSYYYLSANVVYMRPTNSTVWTAVSAPGSGQLSNGIAYDTANSTVYAVFYNSSGIYGIYSTTPGASSWSPAILQSDGSTVFSIGDLFYVNSVLYAVVQTVGGSSPAEYTLYSYNGTSFVPTSPTAPTTQNPVTAATPEGANAWFVTSGELFELAGGAWQTVIPNGTTVYSPLGGIFYDSTGTVTGTANSLWVTAGNSLIKSTDSGATWTAAVASQVGPDNSTNLSLTSLAGFTSSSYSALLVGTKSYGYYVYTSGATTLVVPASASNYAASALATSSITMLYVDPSPSQTVGGVALGTGETGLPLIFAGGSLNGLWETYYGGPSPTWVQD